MNLSLIDPLGAQSKVLDVSPSTFGCEYNEPLVHQVVNSYLATARQGTSAQKTRSEVSGGGAKPWRQKGSGRARAGSNTSPVWVGGGRTFAAKPRDYEQKVNKKMYRGAMRSILSELLRQERLLVLEELIVAEPKTKLLLEKLGKIEVTSALIVVNKWDTNLYLASRNVPNIAVTEVKNLDPVSLLKFKKVVMLADAIAKIEEVLA